MAVTQPQPYCTRDSDIHLPFPSQSSLERVSSSRFRRYLRHGRIPDEPSLLGPCQAPVYSALTQGSRLYTITQHVRSPDNLDWNPRRRCRGNATYTKTTQDPLCRTLLQRHLLLFPPPWSRIRAQDPAPRVAAETAAGSWIGRETRR